MKKEVKKFVAVLSAVGMLSAALPGLTASAEEETTSQVTVSSINAVKGALYVEFSDDITGINEQKPIVATVKSGDNTVDVTSEASGNTLVLRGDIGIDTIYSVEINSDNLASTYTNSFKLVRLLSDDFEDDDVTNWESTINGSLKNDAISTDGDGCLILPSLNTSLYYNGADAPYSSQLEWENYTVDIEINNGKTTENSKIDTTEAAKKVFRLGVITGIESTNTTQQTTPRVAITGYGLALQADPKYAKYWTAGVYSGDASTKLVALNANYLKAEKTVGDMLEVSSESGGVGRIVTVDTMENLTGKITNVKFSPVGNKQCVYVNNVLCMTSDLTNGSNKGAFTISADSSIQTNERPIYVESIDVYKFVAGDETTGYIFTAEKESTQINFKAENLKAADGKIFIAAAYNEDNSLNDAKVATISNGYAGGVIAAAVIYSYSYQKNSVQHHYYAAD